jgi:hypothetical protein
MTLEEKRATWENKSEVVTVIDHSKNPTKGNFLVVTKDSYNENRYRCLRYFSIGDSWEVSVDGDSVELPAVWRWLENPSARACN